MKSFYFNTIVVLIFMLPVRILAQSTNEPEAYAFLVDNPDTLSYDQDSVVHGKTLMFFYDTHKHERNGMSVVGEAPIWTGNCVIGEWNTGMQELAWGGYDWSTAKPGQKLTIYLTPDMSAGWSMIRVGNGSWSPLPGTVDNNNLYGNETMFSVTLTQEMIDDLVANGGLVICGAYFTITRITIDGGFSFTYLPKWYEERDLITFVYIDGSFAKYSSLTSTDMWFYGCRNIRKFQGLYNLNTDNVTGMSHMFASCSGLKKLDVSDLNTQNVVLMDGMFKDCSGLTNLNMNGFNTRKVIDMSLMFQGCSKIKALDIGSFETDTVLYVSSMFEACYELKAIYVGEGWNLLDAGRNSKDMFFGCNKLVGEMGTVYDLGHTDGTYAHVDGGAANPGYFSKKGTGMSFTKKSSGDEFVKVYGLDGRFVKKVKRNDIMPSLTNGVYIIDGKKYIK